jgi:alpha-D-xyloside xylohydrolase
MEAVGRHGRHDPQRSAAGAGASLADHVSSEIAESINYYVISADSMDKVIAGYRQLTGQAPMMPKWAYGFWQSRQRYETQQQLLDTVAEYRKRGWPLDNIVQDWFYWPEDGWGSHDFDKVRFPDPKGMVDAVHKQHARIMISIWGKFYAKAPTTTRSWRPRAICGPRTSRTARWTGSARLQEQPLRSVHQGSARHLLPPDEEAGGPGLRRLVDGQHRTGRAVQHAPGRLQEADRPDRLRPGEITFNPYSLVHSGGMVEGLRRDQPDTRQFILSRSGFAGIQRNSVAVWSGDTVSRWNNLYDQIARREHLDVGHPELDPRHRRLCAGDPLPGRRRRFGAGKPRHRQPGRSRKT